ncbi:MAG: hypothetical protein A3J37_08055 [Alphaproteobacteria bacterium RIFCSPHIGHO2_12_FULL_45_9]|nr:MAG: hypothetical protein A3B66_06265 [Alphaproteobacteria bacterium RIFCSPHIGHO2_02_FULL_46_13]OFW98510.1 MAG: hypothetical protein A3J37_08055 [Alphaproteobacteria bacterium RIFCSPHIGHO2_12_FULL_45_9]
MGGYTLQIKSIQIENYKCFDKTDVIALTSGINLVLGKNNVGKTAFLECFTQIFENHTHKGLDVGYQDHLERRSRVRIQMGIETALFKEQLLSGTLYRIKFPIIDRNNQKRFLESLRSGVICDVIFDSFTHDIIIPEQECYEVFWKDKGGASNDISFKYNAALKEFELYGNPNEPIFLKELVLSTRRYIYRFKAERLNVHLSSSQSHLELEPNARNLAGALNYLYSTNQIRFNKLSNFITDIFSNVYGVSIVPRHDNPSNYEIKIWPVPMETERPDLCIPLAECGTGIGQVLALLFLIITSETPRVILIDEPNSFLHPGAVKKLIEIIKRYPQHQYIISTHSPEVIKTAEPNNVLFLTQENGKTNIECVDLSKFEDQSRCLRDIGVSLSDVFSADSIIWVEGPTEEVCFPLIMKQFSPLKLGLSIIAVKNTGDFDKKSGKEVQWVTEVHTKLSQANALIPRAVGFVFDSEGLTQQSIIDKKREMGEKVEFLPRRMFENYLLDAEAITHALNKLPSFQTSSIEVQAVNDWILANGNEQKYKAADVAVNSEEWLKNVHSASLLEDIFSEFSTATEEYKKTRDSVEITKWLLANKPDTFSEIIDILKKFESKA